MKIRDSFHPYAAVTILFWSFAYVLTRLTLPFFSAYSLGFLRYLIASVTLVAVAVVRRIKPPEKRDWLWFLASGGCGFFLYAIVFNVGTGYVSAATSSVVIASVPVMTALLASFVFRERLKGYQWIAIGVEFCGILVLTLYGGVFTVNRGVLWLLLAALLLSLYNLMQRRLTRVYSALRSTSYSIFIGTLLLALFAPRSLGELADAPPVAVVYLLILGVGSSAVAYVAWSKAMEKAEKTSSVSNYMFFTPFLTSILGLVMAGEVPDLSTLIGGAVIIAGALLFNQASFRKAL